MNPSAPPAQTPSAHAKAGPPLIRALACALALGLAFLSTSVQALAMGSLPWETPDQQQNASAPASNATASEASVSPVSSPPAEPVLEPVLEPADAEGQAQFAVLRQYFRRQLTLAEDFPEVFSRRVKDGESLAFSSMCAMQRRRGLLERFRSAEVDLSGLRFTRVTSDPDLARVRVTGRYSFTLGPKAPPLDSPKAPPADSPKAPPLDSPKAQTTEGPEARTTARAETNATAQATVHETLEEDALFVLLPEQGEWKIYERREGWLP